MIYKVLPGISRCKVKKCGHLANHIAAHNKSEHRHRGGRYTRLCICSPDCPRQCIKCLQKSNVACSTLIRLAASCALHDFKLFQNQIPKMHLDIMRILDPSHLLTPSDRAVVRLHTGRQWPYPRGQQGPGQCQFELRNFDAFICSILRGWRMWR